ncbi:MAG: glutamate--cysteine ligase [Verrucomicrobiaceae bacterium]|nr:glutamate--cysteine ligase [Verrucomicrobiaceae bacterium]
MSESLQQRLAQLSSPALLPLLRQLRRGLEKESLRVDRDGCLAQTPHDPKLGSALTHPLITTDYSESLLEFITLVSADVDTTLAQLDATHRFVYQTLPDENLWTSSMPGMLGGDADIPVARYGDSNLGRMKTIYRVGLGHRYGRRMQTISGIHYNFSLPEALWPHYFPAVPAAQLQQHVTDAYFGLIRNFRRHVWLLIYLFGASPALCKSFLEGKPHRLQELDDYTLYQPYGTALRMGDLGYQSRAQEKLNICYNRLDSYIDTLKNGILNSHPDYERIGVLVDGEYKQLSAGLLQIENEFYSPIRPKRVARQGETALTALAHGGVEYIEVRCVDVNPYLPVGIDAELMRFLDAFLMFCLLSDSPPCDDNERSELLSNVKTTVDEGRKPGVKLHRRGEEIGLQQWADELLDQIAQTAQLLDNAHSANSASSTAHSDSVMQQRRKVADPDLTPSARIVRELRDRKISYSQFVLEKAQQHAADFRGRELSPALQTEFVEMAQRSLQAQAEIEANDKLPFDQYLQKYFDQYRAL